MTQSLTTNAPVDIQRYIDDQMVSPGYFPPFTAALKPLGTRGLRYHAIYITDTNKPAWMGADGTWRYADGSAV